MPVAAGRAHVRRGRRGRESHRRAPQRRLRRRVGGQHLRASATCPRFRAGLTYVEIAAGDDHTAARRSDGSVVAWGTTHYGQCNVPPLPAGPDVRRGRGGIASTRSRAAATARSSRGDNNSLGQCNVPALPAGAHLRRDRGGTRTTRVARRSDGSLVAWGGQRRRPVQRAGAPARAHLRRGRGGRPSHPGAPERRLGRRLGDNGVRPVQHPCAAGGAHLRRGAPAGTAHARAPQRRLGRRVGEKRRTASATCRALPPGLELRRDRGRAELTRVARRSDGSVVAWGTNINGRVQRAAAAGRAHLRRGRRGARAHRGASEQRLRRRVGGQLYGQCNVPALPAGLTYVEIAAGSVHTVGAPQRRLVVAWGDNALGQCNVPALPGGLTYVEVAAGGSTQRRAPAATAPSSHGDTTCYGQCNVPRVAGRARRTSRSRRAMRTRSRAAATAPSSRGAATHRASATCRRCRPGSPTSRSRRASTHGGAAERRLRRRVGRQPLGAVQRPALALRLRLPRDRGRRRSIHGAVWPCRFRGRRRLRLRRCGDPHSRFDRAAHRPGHHFFSDPGDAGRRGVPLLQRGPRGADAVGFRVRRRGGSWGAEPVASGGGDAGGMVATLLVPPDPNLVGVEVALQIALFGTLGSARRRHQQRIDRDDRALAALDAQCSIPREVIGPLLDRSAA